MNLKADDAPMTFYAERNTPSARGWSWKRRHSMALLVILFVALGLRLHRLMLLPAFWDEVIHINRAHSAAFEGNLMMQSYGGKLVQPWLTALALQLPLNLEILVVSRIVSAVVGTLNCLWIYLLASRLYGRLEVGLAAAGLYAVSPYVLFLDRMAMADGLLSGFSVLCLLLSLQVVRSTRTWLVVALGLGMGFAAITKTNGVLFFSYPLLVVALMPGLHARRWLLRRFLLSWLIAVPFSLLPMFQWGSNYGGMGSKLGTSASADGFNLLARWGANLGRTASALWVYLTPPVLLAGGAELVRGLRLRDHWQVPVLLLSAGAVTIGFFVTVATPALLYPRYFLPAFPFLLILASGFMIRIVDLIWARLGASRGVALPALSALFLVFFGWSVPSDYWQLSDPVRANLLPVDRAQYVAGPPAGYGIQDGAAFLEDQADQAGSIYVVAEWTHMWDFFLEEREDIKILPIDLQETGSDVLLEGAGSSPYPVFLILDRPGDDSSAAAILSDPRFQDNAQTARFPRPGGESWIEIYRISPQ
jgi:hypothetical protein